MKEQTVTGSVSLCDETSRSPAKDEKTEEYQSPSEKAYSLKSKYFVSNLFVEKIFDTMNCTYAQQIATMEQAINNHSDEIGRIRDELLAKLPQVEGAIEVGFSRQKMAIIKLYDYITDAKNKTLKQKAWFTFRKNRDDNFKNRDRVRKLLRIFRKYQTFHAFVKFCKKTNWELMLKDRSRIDGAYLLLKRFKGRLKLFDQALEKLHDDKASKDDLDTLALSLDKHRATSLFNDMKQLYDKGL